ncbi:acyltransferase [Escherichia coli]|uniref:acyltransferase n=1 Tax=Escherichia coli TaxID=562 RepID=UPI003B27BD7D
MSDDVWIGAGSVITKNTYIGKHSVIGANSVVRGELQSNSIYAGNPTKLIRKINA